MGKREVVIVGNAGTGTTKALEAALEEEGLTMDDVVFVDPNDTDKLKEIAEKQKKVVIKSSDLIMPPRIEVEPRKKEHPFKKFMGKKKRR